jgi:hypothetical protein
MHKLTAFAFAALFATSGLAQEASPDTSHNQQEIQAAISSYFQFINEGTGLYNGVEHKPYFYKIEGFAYYKTNEWQNATIEYNGVLYTNIPAKYDLVKDQVIVKHPTGLLFSLFSSRVTYFTLGDDRFIYIPEGVNKLMPVPGFYQQLRRGKLTILAKRSKLIEESIEQQEVKRWFTDVNKYYVVKDGVFYSPRKEASLLTLLGEHRTEAKQAFRKAKIRFRKAPEQAILIIADYYNK